MDQTNDEQRPPRSTVKVIGGLVLAAVAGFALLGACLSLVVSSTPKHTLEAPTREISVGAPRFYPQPSFGADTEGRTFGVWVLVPESGETRAFSSQDPSSGCFVNWRGELTVESVTGVFVDECAASRYDRTGAAIAGPAARGLDGFDLELTGAAVVIDLERLRLGPCRAQTTAPSDCSAPGLTRYEER